MSSPDNKGDLSRPLMANAGGHVSLAMGPGEVDVVVEVPPKPQNTIASIAFFSLVILALSIAALESPWYMGRLNTTTNPSSGAAGVTTTQAYEMSIGLVKLTTTTSTRYADYTQLVLSKTGSVMSAINAFTVVVLVSSLLLFLMSIVAYAEDPRKTVVGTDLGSYLYENAPRWLASLTLIFTIGVILLPLAFTRTLRDDDILRQTTSGAISCQMAINGYQPDCAKFWEAQTTTIPGAAGASVDYTDLHRPSDAWWISLVMLLFTFALAYRVWKYKDVIGLKEERDAAERVERARQAQRKS